MSLSNVKQRLCLFLSFRQKIKNKSSIHLALDRKRSKFFGNLSMRLENLF